MTEVSRVEVEAPARPDRFAIVGADPAFKYRFVNSKEVRMSEMLMLGWQVCRGDSIPPGMKAQVFSVLGQSSEHPAGGEVVQRGDLILCRMPREKWEQEVRAPVIRARKRQAVSLDTMVDQANEEIRGRLKAASQRNIREKHVFGTTDDSKFEGGAST